MLVGRMRRHHVGLSRLRTPPKEVAAFSLAKLAKLAAVVFALFVVLALLFPAIPGSHPTAAARRAMAKNDVVQIANAIQAYEVEYGSLPIFSSGEEGKDIEREVNGDLLAALTGKDPAHNPRKILFLEVQPAKPGHGGITRGAFADPEGGIYRVALDSDGDGKLALEVPASVSSGTEIVTVQRPVAVWTVNEKPRYRVRSWE
jgi:hypothetical protein